MKFASAAGASTSSASVTTRAAMGPLFGRRRPDARGFNSGLLLLLGALLHQRDRDLLGVRDPRDTGGDEMDEYGHIRLGLRLALLPELLLDLLVELLGGLAGGLDRELE